MWLVLCPENDAPTRWAYHGLQARGLSPLEWVSAESLGLGARWEHRVGAAGVSFEVTLADGRRIRSGEVRGTLNRLLYPPLEGLPLFDPGDRDYVRQELQSFFMSWLSALPGPVLNRPTPWGLSGRWRHVSEWIALAGRAGLPVPPYSLSSRDVAGVLSTAPRPAPAGTPPVTLIVVAGTTVGAPATPEIRAGCVRLAELVQTALLGVDFVRAADGEWVFYDASPAPDLRLGGEALLDALACALGARRRLAGQDSRQETAPL